MLSFIMAPQKALKVSSLVAICLLCTTVIHVQAGEGTVRSSGKKKSVEQIYFLETDEENSDPIVRYLREDETFLRPVSDEQRRSLSVWSSFMNFIHCPIHHDNNPHCHHGGGGHGGGGGHNKSSGNGGGSSSGGGDGNNSNSNNSSSNNNNGNNNNNNGNDNYNNNNNGNDNDNYNNNNNNNGNDNYNNNNNGNDNDNYYYNNNNNNNNGDNWNGNSPIPTSPPTPNEVSNDMPCWWRGTGCSHNGRSPYFADGSEGSSFGNTSPIFIGFGASVTGAAVIASLVLRKRYQQSTAADADAANQHMLSGAVAKRNKTFSAIFRKDSNSMAVDHDTTSATNYVIA